MCGRWTDILLEIADGRATPHIFFGATYYKRCSAEHLLYLAMVLDVYSRRVVGWAMEAHLKTELILSALNMALAQRRPKNVIHHSDRGCQPRLNGSSQQLVRVLIITPLDIISNRSSPQGSLTRMRQKPGAQCFSEKAVGAAFLEFG
jgi:hypothetical protein